jgi:hypothetical protein
VRYELLWKDGVGWLAEEEELSGQLHCSPVIYICIGDLLTQQKQQGATIESLGILYMFNTRIRYSKTNCNNASLWYLIEKCPVLIWYTHQWCAPCQHIWQHGIYPRNWSSLTSLAKASLQRTGW